MNKTEQHKRAMIEALEQSLGIVSEACRICKVGRTTHYDWLESDPEYKQAVEAIGDIALDFVESQLFKQIKEQNTTATIFYLNNKGKRRGYNTGLQHQTTEQGEQAKITLPNGTQISI